MNTACEELRFAVPVEHLGKLLGTKTYERVDNACRNWNARLRKLVANETALRQSSSEDTSVTIRVSVLDGLPAQLAKAIADIPPVILELLLHRRELEAVRPGLAFLKTRWLEAVEVLDLQFGPDAKSIIETSRSMIDNILLALAKYDFDEVVKSSYGDPWGRYVIKSHSIEIYWMSIGLFASQWGLDEGDMAAVVLAHELVHAYTHIGFDTQDVQWETASFGRCSPDIVEGLAQYYTESICRHVAVRDPKLIEAFERMLAKQDGPYIVHRNWFPVSTKSDHEAVRRAMLIARRRGITQYDEFLVRLADGSKELGPVKPTQVGFF